LALGFYLWIGLHHWSLSLILALYEYRINSLLSKIINNDKKLREVYEESFEIAKKMWISRRESWQKYEWCCWLFGLHIEREEFCAFRGKDVRLFHGNAVENTMVNFHTPKKNVCGKLQEVFDEETNAKINRAKFGWKDGKFIVTPGINLDQGVAQYLNSEGLQINPDEITIRRMNNNGGHNHMRYIADSLLVSVLNEVESKKTEIKYVWDLGSKLTSTLHKYVHLFKSNVVPETFATHYLAGEDGVDTNRLFLVRPRIGQDEHNDETNTVQWNLLCNELDARGLEHNLRELCRNEDFEEDYTFTTVHCENRNGIFHSRRVIVHIFPGTFKEAVDFYHTEPRFTNLPQQRIHNIICNDTHYYLDEDLKHIIRNYGDFCVQTEFFVTGMKYTPILGNYQYLKNEGVFKVVDNGKNIAVFSKPNTATCTYNHPVVHHVCTQIIDFQHYAWFIYRGSLPGFKLGAYPSLLKSSETFEIKSSLQHTWLANKLKILEKLELGEIIPTAFKGSDRWIESMEAYLKRVIFDKREKTSQELTTLNHIFRILYGLDAQAYSMRFDANFKESSLFREETWQRKWHLSIRSIRDNVWEEWVTMINGVKAQKKLDSDRLQNPHMDGMNDQRDRMMQYFRHIRIQGKQLKKEITNKFTVVADRLSQKRKDLIYFLEKRIPDTAFETISRAISKDVRAREKVNILQRIYGTCHAQAKKLKAESWIQTGWRIVNEFGTAVREFEWNASSNIGMIFGLLNRHLQPRICADPIILERFKQMVNIMFRKLFRDINSLPIKILTVEDWIKSKSWDISKKNKYMKVIYEQLAGLRKIKGVYKGAIKSGEVYYSTSLNTDGEGFSNPNSSRYRFFVMPSENYCGILTYIQYAIFKDLRATLPEFCHALNSKKLKKRIWKNLKLINSNISQLRSLSIDGSAFDSTQHQEIIEIVDNCFWKNYSNRLYLILEKIEGLNGIEIPDKKTFVKMIVNAACEDIAHIFIKIRGETSQTWLNAEEQLLFDIHYGHEERPKALKRGVCQYIGWMCFHIEGTTYSGNPVRTTLGNTLRSVLYMYFYAQEAGVFNTDQWLTSIQTIGIRRIFVLASGDDTVVWGEAEDIRRIEDSIRQLTTGDKNHQGEHGLGQIVCDVFTSEWWENEFCSKWFFFPENGSTLKEWKCTRDVNKLLSTKQMYIGDNLEMLSDPVLHAKAILAGVCAEVPSLIIQKMMLFRAKIMEGEHGKELASSEVAPEKEKEKDSVSKLRKWNRRVRIYRTLKKRAMSSLMMHDIRGFNNIMSSFGYREYDYTFNQIEKDRINDLNSLIYFYAYLNHGDRLMKFKFIAQDIQLVKKPDLEYEYWMMDKTNIEWSTLIELAEDFVLRV
jgi:hypothetical protein